MKKQDRLTRLVERATASDPGTFNGAKLDGWEVLKLLRAEARAVRRVVRKQQRWNPGGVKANGKVVMRIKSDGHFIYLPDLLASLEKRGKG